MTEAGPPAPSGERLSAGAMLRQLRERQGLHLGVVAATLKVPVRRLEALEADRLEDFGGVSFARALAQAVCRILKADPAPVLAALPAAEQPTSGLIEVTASRQDRFAEGGAGSVAARAPGGSGVSRGLLLAALGLLLASALVFWLPGKLQGVAPAPVQGSAPPAEAASPAPAGPAAQDGAPSSAASSPASAPLAAPDPASAPLVSAAPAPAVLPPTPVAAPAPKPAPEKVTPPDRDAALLRSREPSWIEATDADRNVVMSRILQPGETVVLTGRRPWQLVIGNAPATEVQLRGRPVDLAPYTRDNVARVELN